MSAVAPPAVSLLDAPLATAELLVVDTETNGLGGDRCELTEIGAVLVGGGELHDRWETLVPVRAPLSRGIQRFTGITQAMVDEAPPAEATLPELAEQLEGRVLVAHNASFDRRVLAQAFARAGVPWPDPPTICTIALARQLHPLARQRKLRPLAESLGIEVEVSHRALADAETCARVLCALFPRLCAHAATVGDALALLRSKRRRAVRVGRTDGGVSLQGARRRKVDCSALPEEPGVYVFRNGEGQPLYVGKSVNVRARAKAHFQPSSPDTGWVAQAELVEHRETHSELGALLLEQELIRRLRPPGNVRAKHDDRWVYLRCRLDIAYPILEVAPEPAPGLAVNVGPLLGRHAAVELAEQLTSLFALRHCGRSLPRRMHPSAYGQMGRCLSPCLGDLDPNAYRRRLDQALALFTGDRDGSRAVLAHLDAEIRAAAGDQRYERAGWRPGDPHGDHLAGEPSLAGVAAGAGADAGARRAVPGAGAGGGVIRGAPALRPPQKRSLLRQMFERLRGQSCATSSASGDRPRRGTGCGDAEGVRHGCRPDERRTSPPRGSQRREPGAHHAAGRALGVG